MIPNRFIADLLIRAGVVDRAAITKVAEAQQKHCATLGRALAGLGLADEAVVAAAIASALHLDYFEVEATEPGANVAKLLTELTTLSETVRTHALFRSRFLRKTNALQGDAGRSVAASRYSPDRSPMPPLPA